MPIELVESPDRKVKNMAVGEKAQIPLYSLYVTPSRKIFINLDQKLQERLLSMQMVEIERLRRGFRLYLPADLQERVKTSRASYLRIPWRWFLGIRPVLEVFIRDAEEAT